MEEVEFTIRGTSALLMNSDRAIDPTIELSREIKRITDKKSKKTDAEAEQVHRLCWERAMSAFTTRHMRTRFREDLRPLELGEPPARDLWGHPPG